MMEGKSATQIQGDVASGPLQPRFKQTAAAAVQWIVTGILIAWVVLCLAVSILTFLAGVFAGMEPSAPSAIHAVDPPPAA
jgi:hypothetical protein